MVILKRRTDTLFLSGYGEYISYGVDVYNEEGTQILHSVQDISPEMDKVDTFIELCNNNGLDEIHLYDLIEDFFLTI